MKIKWGEWHQQHDEIKFSTAFPTKNTNFDNHPWTRGPLWDSGISAEKFQHIVGKKSKLDTLKIRETVSLYPCHPSPSSVPRDSQPLMPFMGKRESMQVSTWLLGCVVIVTEVHLTLTLLRILSCKLPDWSLVSCRENSSQGSEKNYWRDTDSTSIRDSTGRPAYEPLGTPHPPSGPWAPPNSAHLTHKPLTMWPMYPQWKSAWTLWDWEKAHKPEILASPLGKQATGSYQPPTWFCRHTVLRTMYPSRGKKGVEQAYV